MKFRRAILAVLMLLSSGCTYETMLSPQNWRAYINEEGMYSSKKIIVVNRPYADIAKIWGERAEACVNNSKVYDGRANANIFYKTTSVIEKNKVELHIQRKYYGRSIYHSDKEPSDGYYFFVADAIPLAGNKSRVEIYHYKIENSLAVAVSNWATGKNMGCPDLTQN